MPVIGHLRHSRVNHAPSNWFFLAVFMLFVQLTEQTYDFFHTKEVLKDFAISISFSFIDTINWQEDFVSYNSGVIALIISNRPNAYLKLLTQSLTELYSTQS